MLNGHVPLIWDVEIGTVQLNKRSNVLFIMFDAFHNGASFTLASAPVFGVIKYMVRRECIHRSAGPAAHIQPLPYAKVKL